MKKEAIIDNVEEFSAQQLVDFIKRGEVSFEELVTESDGEFDANKRKEVKRLLESGDEEAWKTAKQENTVEALQDYLDSFPEGQYRNEARKMKADLERVLATEEVSSKDDDQWDSVDKSSRESLLNFVQSYPGNVHINEANELLNNIMIDEIMGVDVETLISKIRQFQTDRTLSLSQRDNNIVDTIKEFLETNKVSKDEFLKKLKEDHNLLSAGIVKRLMTAPLNLLTLQDLLSIGIDRKFIQKMFNGDSAQGFSTPERLEKINKQSTEIYFWGIPSSGKSCALGAILSVADSGKVAKSMDPDTESQGYGYMTKLINLFQEDEVGTLMEGTPVGSFYEMGFDLVDQEGKIHPITCVDMAGELMKCMYKSNAGDPMTQEETEMLDVMTKVLIDNRSTNRKMHFFVVEYGAEDRLYEGLPQKVYLNGAVSYIKNTGIFKKDTDAIYLMISKADKMKNATPQAFNKYIEDKYLGFFNGLEQICKENEINKGRVEKIAFSLGDVCFQNYCKFNAKPAENVVNIILQRSACYRGGKRGMLERMFRG